MTESECAAVRRAIDALREIDVALAAFALLGNTERPDVREAAWRVTDAAGKARTALRDITTPTPPARGWGIGWHLKRWVARRM